MNFQLNYIWNRTASVTLKKIVLAEVFCGVHFPLTEFCQEGFYVLEYYYTQWFTD